MCHGIANLLEFAPSVCIGEWGVSLPVHVHAEAKCQDPRHAPSYPTRNTFLRKTSHCTHQWELLA